MNIRKFDVWLINFIPARGTMPGKTRPAIVIQTNSLNRIAHPSTLVIPITSKAFENTSILRLKIEPSIQNGLKKVSYAVMDQLTTVDNLQVKERIGEIEITNRGAVMYALKSIFDID